jgi:hypothetical protein
MKTSIKYTAKRGDEKEIIHQPDVNFQALQGNINSALRHKKGKCTASAYMVDIMKDS